jgi:iron complex outermembrane receptor protein
MKLHGSSIEASDVKARHLGVALAAMSAILLMSSKVDAQAAGTPEATTPDEALTEIVVTSTKRPEDLQRAPAAITVVTGSELINIGITDMEGVSDLIPSARFEPIGSNTHIYIRGIGSEQDRVFVNQLVATVIDGTYMPRNTTNIPLFDVAQIEVLPGPQGTLYGANAVGGVVQIVNNRPTQNFESSAMVEFGNFASVHATLIENFPLSDSVAIRAALDYDKHGDYETGGAYSLNSTAGRVSVLAKPSDEFTAYLWGSYSRDTGNPADLVVVTGNGPTFYASNPWDALACASSPCSFIPRENVGPNRGDVSVGLVGGQFDWALAGGTLSLIPTYVNSSSDETTYVGPISDVQSTTHRQYTSELRFTGDLNPKLKLIAGLYWLKSNDFMDFAVGAPGNPIVENYENDYSGYGQLTYSVVDSVRLTGGVRLASQSKEDDYSSPKLDPASHTWHHVDWKAGIEDDVAANSMLYAAVQTGFANGTFDPSNEVAGKPNLVDPTTLLSYTLGIKNRFLNGRLEVNDELYYYDYKKYLIQTAIDQPGGAIVSGFFSAPKVIAYGDQLDLRALITDNFQVRTGIGYLHARAKTFTTPAGEIFVNYPLFESPEVTVSLGAQYRWGLNSGADIKLRVDTFYSSSYLGDDFPIANGDLQQAFTKTNAALTYQAPHGRWSVALYGNNLENKAQLNPGLSIGAGVTAGLFEISPPRTFGIRFTAKMSGVAQ